MHIKKLSEAHDKDDPLYKERQDAGLLSDNFDDISSEESKESDNPDGNNDEFDYSDNETPENLPTRAKLYKESSNGVDKKFDLSNSKENPYPDLFTENKKNEENKLLNTKPLKSILYYPKEKNEEEFEEEKMTFGQPESVHVTKLPSKVYDSYNGEHKGEILKPLESLLMPMTNSVNVNTPKVRVEPLGYEPIESRRTSTMGLMSDSPKGTPKTTATASKMENIIFEEEKQLNTKIQQEPLPMKDSDSSMRSQSRNIELMHIYEVGEEEEYQIPVIFLNKDSEDADKNYVVDTQRYLQPARVEEKCDRSVAISELPLVPDVIPEPVIVSFKSKSVKLKPGFRKLKFKSALKMLKSSTYKVNKSKNPEKFKGLISKLKLLQSKKFDDIENLDKHSKKRIKLILKLERSPWFYFCNFITFWLDYYARIAYPLLEILYLIYMFVLTTQNDAIIYTTVAIECILIVVIISTIITIWYFKLKRRVRGILKM
jgi:hypothetical protein